MEKGKKNEELFCSMPVPQAILRRGITFMTGQEELQFKKMTQTPVPRLIATLAVPTIISMLVTSVYNMADTFFIGQLGDPKQVAAATLAMPLFMFRDSRCGLGNSGG